jgi:hypothetical protein
MSYKAYDIVRPKIRCTISYTTCTYDFVRTVSTMSYVFGDVRHRIRLALSQTYDIVRITYDVVRRTYDVAKRTTSYVQYRMQHRTYDVVYAMLRTPSYVRRTMSYVQTYDIVPYVATGISWLQLIDLFRLEHIY